MESLSRLSPVESQLVARSKDSNILPLGFEKAPTRPEARTAPIAQRPSVCFVAPKAYAALSEREDVPHVGGAERQQVLFAEELMRRGYRVDFSYAQSRTSALLTFAELEPIQHGQSIDL